MSSGYKPADPPESMLTTEEMDYWNEEINPNKNKVRSELYKEANGRCSYCGTTLDPFNFHVDHHIPRSKGGTNERTNLYACCPPCNRKKGAMDADDFRYVLFFDRIGAPRFTEEQARWLWDTFGINIITEYGGLLFHHEKPMYGLEDSPALSVIEGGKE